MIQMMKNTAIIIKKNTCFFHTMLLL